MVRAGTVGTHPRFVETIRESVRERRLGAPARHRPRLSPGVCAAVFDVRLEGDPAREP